VVLPHFGFYLILGLRVRARHRLDTARTPAHLRCAWGSRAWFCKESFVFGAPARPHAGCASKWGKM